MKQRSPFPLSGSTEHFTFYSTRHGHFVRRKSKKIDKKRIATDPRFEAVRNASAEFTTVMNSAKLIRNSFRQLVQHAKSGNMNTRLTSLLFSVIKTDKVNRRGLRKVSDGNIEMLQGFEFNDKIKLENVLRIQYTVSLNRPTGDVDLTVPRFVSPYDLQAPSGATHYRFVLGAADLDFENEENNYAQSMSEQLAIKEPPGNSIHLQVKLAGKLPGVALVMVGIEFYEQTGNTITRLQQAALKIVHASKP